MAVLVTVCLLKEHPGFTPESRAGQSAAMSGPFHTPMALSSTLGFPMLSSVNFTFSYYITLTNEKS